MGKKEKKDEFGSPYENISIFDVFGSDLFGTEIEIPQPHFLAHQHQETVAEPKKKSILELSQVLLQRQTPELSAILPEITEAAQSFEETQVITASDTVVNEIKKETKKRKPKKSQILADSYHAANEYGFLGTHVTFEDGAETDFHVVNNLLEDGTNSAFITSARTIFDYDDEDGLPLNHTNRKKNMVKMSKEVFISAFLQEIRRRKELEVN